MWAQDRGSPIPVCFSAASDDSDGPFISTLEVRELQSTLPAVGILTETVMALRTIQRVDLGASSQDSHSVIR